MLSTIRRTALIPPSLKEGYEADWLLRNEFNGFAIDATLENGRVSVMDNATPANNLANVILDKSNLTQSGTSPKMVLWNSSPYVRWTPHNLSLQSEVISNASWTKSGATVTDNATTAPDGASTADEVVESATNAPHNAYQTVNTNIVNGFTYTWSVYCKANTRSFVALQLALEVTGNERYTVVFNLSNGTVADTTSKGTPTGTANSITSVGGGWYRCTVTGTAEGTTVYPVVALSDIGTPAYDATSNLPTYNGNGTSGAYFWGAQLVRGVNANPYIATTTTARIGIPQEYDSAASKFGILVEPAATNLVLRSEQLDNASWTKENASISANADTAPDGATAADRIVEDATATARHHAYQTITATAAVYCSSIFVKAGTRDHAWFSLTTYNGVTVKSHGVNVNLTNGSVQATNDVGSPANTSTTITSVGDGWYRIALTMTCIVDGNGTFCDVGASTSTASADATNGGFTHNGDGSSYVLAWGAQVETGSVASSYVPTLGSTVTRAADDINLATSSLPFSDTAGSLYGEFVFLHATAVADTLSPRLVVLDNGTNNESLSLARAATTNLGNINVTDGGVAQASVSGAAMAGTPTINKLAGRWAANDFECAVNGALSGAADTSGTLPTVTTMRLGNLASSSSRWPGYIHKVIYVPRIYNDAELQTKTT